jgi:hypothetical protein
MTDPARIELETIPVFVLPNGKERTVTFLTQNSKEA